MEKQPTYAQRKKQEFTRTQASLMARPGYVRVQLTRDYYEGNGVIKKRYARMGDRGWISTKDKEIVGQHMNVYVRVILEGKKYTRDIAGWALELVEEKLSA